MKRFGEWLEALAVLETQAATIEPDPAPFRLAAPAPDAPVALIASPHPDDEVIVGGLALRLRLEGWRVVNLAVTLGSDYGRRAARWEELKAACAQVGFDVVRTQESGLEKICPATRESEPEAWGRAVSAVSAVLEQWAPQVVFFPHPADHHPTHIGVHYLLQDALRATGQSANVWTVETEYWGALTAPNLLVEIPEPVLAQLLEGLRQHVGEVSRNPYHLSLPSWMRDAVRRGSEVIGGAGVVAADFRYGTLYRRSRGGVVSPPCILPATVAASSLFE